MSAWHSFCCRGQPGAPLGVLKHTRVASVDGIAVVVCANMARYCVYSGKGEAAIFYLTVGLHFDAGVWALFASPRRVTALEKLAEGTRRATPNASITLHMAVAVAGLIIHNDEIKQYIRSRYSLLDLDRLETFLFERGVLSFEPLQTGLYPATQREAATSGSGYHYVWVRDNVFVAHAHYVNGRVDAAVSVVRGLSAFFSKYLFRFDDIIAGAVDHKAPMNRAHIRFDGDSLSELPEKWSHAQNDALGYFVWLFCNLASAGAIPLTGGGFALLEKFIAYFSAIQFWEDEDSGHWEEVSKISASSIGVVVGGLEAMKAMLNASARRQGLGAVRNPEECQASDRSPVSRKGGARRHSACRVRSAR